MKKITIFTALLALLGTFIPVCAQEHQTKPFSAIEVSGGDVNVYFQQGEGHSFSVSGPARLLKKLTVKTTKEGTLFVDYKEPFFTGDDDDVSVYVTAPQLSAVAVSGEADFKFKTAFQGQNLAIKTRQNGEVSMKGVNVGQVNIDAKGSSSVDLDYVEANKIRVSSQDRAEVEISGRTGQLEIANKGMFAEIDTEKLTATQTTQGASKTSQQVAADGSEVFTFN